jgi:hypothetical protein
VESTVIAESGHMEHQPDNIIRLEKHGGFWCARFSNPAVIDMVGDDGLVCTAYLDSLPASVVKDHLQNEWPSYVIKEPTDA